MGGGKVLPITDGLVSWWGLGEASGVRVDSHGSNDLSDNATVGQAAGKIGNAASFTAASAQFLSVADNATLGFTTALTVSMWLYQTDLAVDRAFIGKWTYQTDGEWVIQSHPVDSADVTVYLATSAGDDGTGCRMDFNDANLSATTWYNLVMIYDGSLTGDANRLKMYLNGAALTLTVSAGAVPATLLNGGATLNLGKYGGSLTRYFNGRLDEVALWNRALTANDVAALYYGGTGIGYPG